MKFKMIGGTYVDSKGAAKNADGSRQPGKTYRYNPDQETVIESDEELDVQFKNMFVRLDSPTMPTPMDHSDAPDASGAVMDDLLAQKVAKGAKSPAPAANPPARTRGAENRGRKPGGEVPLTQDTTAEAESEEEDEEDTEEETQGEDVTGQFKDAKKADLKIMKTGKGYTAVDGTDPTVTPDGGGSLKNKAAVNNFIKKYRKG
jgi:hypothetical protein